MKQRLLLMLDEFPQLGNLKLMESALAVCAGYGIKVCIVAQDVNQLNKEYTKDTSSGKLPCAHIFHAEFGFRSGDGGINLKKFG